MKSFKKVQAQIAQPPTCSACGNHVADIAYVDEEGEMTSQFFQCRECTFLFARPIFIPELDNRQMDEVEHAELFNSRILTGR